MENFLHRKMEVVNELNYNPVILKTALMKSGANFNPTNSAL